MTDRFWLGLIVGWFTFSIVYFILSCGSESALVPVVVSTVDEQDLPVCFQKTNSPPYPEQLSNFIELSSSGLTGVELDKAARVYDCLHGRGLITSQEHACLMDDLINLQVVVVQGTNDGDFSCGSVDTAGGCVRGNTIILGVNASSQTFPHEVCHIAEHRTLGTRGHDLDNGFWIIDSGGGFDCTCQKDI